MRARESRNATPIKKKSDYGTILRKIRANFDGSVITPCLQNTGIKLPEAAA